MSFCLDAAILFAVGGSNTPNYGYMTAVDTVDLSGNGLTCSPTPDFPVGLMYPVGATGKSS